MTEPPEDRFYEDVFVLLGEVSTERIIRKVLAECPTEHLTKLRDAMRLAVGRFHVEAAGRASALREVIEALEQHLERN